MEEIKIYSQPMTEDERAKNIGKPLKMPVRYHLIDCLKELRHGRPVDNQNQIDRWIGELEGDLEKGVPFN